MTSAGAHSPRGPGGRRSRTPFVVLGMLTYGPASAYMLRKRISSSVGHFWQESYGQLFPTLAQLEQDGLIQGRERRVGGRRRRDYEITPAGRDALADWLGEPPIGQPERNELLLKVFFASEGEAEMVRSFVAEAETAARARWDVLRRIEAGLRAATTDDPRASFRLLTVRYGILGLEAFRVWAREALDALARSAGPSAEARR
jgi:PadR family transcriptional regulator AphA